MPGTGYWHIAQQKYSIDEKDFNWDRVEDMGFVLAWEDSERKLTMKEYWQRRQDLDLLYIGSQTPENMAEIMDQYETEMLKLQENNIVFDRSD